MPAVESVARFAGRVQAFCILFDEAHGFGNKIALCRYVMSTARRHSTTHEKYGELILGFRHAKLCFGVGAGELNSYIEIFLEDDYRIAEIDFQRPRCVILDVGANIGVFSIAAAKRFPDATIHSFEPNPEAYPRLVRNLELNGTVNVRPVNRAVHSSCGVLNFSGDNSTSVGRVIDSGTLSIEAVTLDDFCSHRGIREIGLIKIDVEGAEVEVLKGARATLEMTDWLVVECHSAELASNVEDVLLTQRFQKVSERRVAQGGGVLRFKKETL
jgi:FkbM family methyltransferase